MDHTLDTTAITINMRDLGMILVGLRRSFLAEMKIIEIIGWSESDYNTLWNLHKLDRSLVDQYAHNVAYGVQITATVHL